MEGKRIFFPACTRLYGTGKCFGRFRLYAGIRWPGPGEQDRTGIIEDDRQAAPLWNRSRAEGILIPILRKCLTLAVIAYHRYHLINKKACGGNICWFLWVHYCLT